MNTRSDGLGLAADDLSYTFDTKSVIEDVSIRVRPGKAMALAGPNGSGKTTLLSLLSGVRRPMRGRVTLDGRPLSELRPRQIARRVAVVSQHVDAHLTFTVESLVAMGRTPYTSLLGYPTAEDRLAVEAALEVTEIRILRGRRFDELSGGEQRRVVLAMALAQETDYVLLDEPTAHLDLRHQHQILEALKRLRMERKVGILAVMHDLNLAALYFDQIALLNEGHMVSSGSTAEVLSRHGDLAIFRAPLTLLQHPTANVPQVLLDPQNS